MIKQRKLLGSVTQYYLYVGGLYDGWYTCAQLSILPECVVSKRRLMKRLYNVSRGHRTKQFNNVFDCMTVKLTKPKTKPVRRKKTPDEIERQVYFVEKWLWPAGSMSHTVR